MDGVVCVQGGYQVEPPAWVVENEPGAVDGMRPSETANSRFVRHAFVCTAGESCGVMGGPEVHAKLKALLRESGLKESIRVNKSGCLGQCGHGPMVAVYPEAVWYSHVGVEDASRLWSQHLVGGRAVSDLRYVTPEAGTNVLGRNADGTHTALGGPRSSPCTRCPSP